MIRLLSVRASKPFVINGTFGIDRHSMLRAGYRPVAVLHFVVRLRQQKMDFAVAWFGLACALQDPHRLRVIALNVGAKRRLERFAGVHAIRRRKSRGKKKRDNGVNESANSHWAVPENWKHRD